VVTGLLSAGAVPASGSRQAARWYKQPCTVAAGVQQLWLFEFLAPTEMLTCDKFGAHATNHLRSVHPYQQITKADNRRLKYII